MTSQLTLSFMLSTVSPSLSLSPSPSPPLSHHTPELPALRRSPRSSRSQRQLQTILPKTNSYVITHSLFQRTALSTNPPSVQYTCMQLSCDYSKKMLTTWVVSTSNLIKHYNTYYKDIPTSIAKEKQLKRLEKAEFFKKHNARTRDNI